MATRQGAIPVVTNDQIKAMLDANADPAVIARALAQVPASATATYFLAELEDPEGIKLTITDAGWKDLNAFFLKPNSNKQGFHVQQYHGEWLDGLMAAIKAKDAAAMLEYMLLYVKAHGQDRYAE